MSRGPFRDAGQRTGILAEVRPTDVSYTKPIERFGGIRKLAEPISTLTAAFLDYLPGRASNVEAYQDAARYDWTVGDRAGQTVLRGIQAVRCALEMRLTS